MAQSSVGPWPQFRGPGGAGKSTAKGIVTQWSQKENILWKKELPGPGSSSPILVGDRIFLTCYSGYGAPGNPGSQDQLRRYVLCLDKKDGRIVWQKEVQSKLPESEKIREGHGFASSTPAADAERIYVFFGKSGLHAFDHAGNHQWQADVGDKAHEWGSGASPIVHGDLVYVNASVESGTLYAFDRRTGKERWRANGIRESWNSPIVVSLTGGKEELVVAGMGDVFGIDPTSGERLWSCKTDIGWYMAPSMVAESGVIYCLGGRSGIVGLAVRSGGRGNVTGTHRLWTTKKGSNVTSPIVHEGHLYWMSDVLGIAYCAEAKTCNIIYEERLPRADQVYASPVLVDGRIIYTTRSGRSFVLPAQPKFELLSTNDLGDRQSERGMFNASPAVADGRIYLRSDRYLYCIGKN
ncbi:MAG: PQQ-like beta-propeller repeat protein [Gemmataceae bacterium]|nr:PQQ-like beta-propeller repeat protein [Gemmataceae bacterium]